MWKKIALYAAVVGATFSLSAPRESPAAGDDDVVIYCSGFIDDYDVARWGALYIDGEWNADDQLLCYFDGSFGGVSADICKAWLLTIQSAMERKAWVKLKYVNVGVDKCADLPTWSNITKAPEYIRVYSDEQTATLSGK